MRLFHLLTVRAFATVVVSLIVGCSSSKTEEPSADQTATAETPPQSQPGSPASAASLPADHTTSTKALTLEDLFKMPESPTDIVLRVEDREVKRDALELQLRQIQIELAATGSPGYLSRLEVLNGAMERLIELEVRALLGKKLKIEIKQEKVDAWLANLEERIKANPSFETFLLRAGRDKQRRIEDARQAVLTEEIFAALDKQARNQLEQDAKAYYEDHKKDYFEREGREVWRMTISAPKTTVQRDMDLAKQQAEELYKKVKKNPKNFTNFAKSYSQDGKASDGGYLGYLAKGTLAEDIEKEIWDAKDGTVLPLRNAGVGYHIYRVGKKREARQMSFDEVGDKILRTIYAASLRKLVEEEMEKLRGEIKVEILVPELVALRAEADKRRQAMQDRIKELDGLNPPKKP